MSQSRSLAQSATKTEFLAHLSLTEGDAASERLHKKMMGEAKLGRERLSRSLESIAPYNQADPELRQPYSWAQIMETAKHREVLAIYESASPETKPLYDRAHYMDGSNQENWAIQWLLWHSFRSYRLRPSTDPTSDVQERGSQGSGPSVSSRNSHQDANERSSPRPTQAATSGPTTPQEAPAQFTRPYYDPVRDI